VNDGTWISTLDSTSVSNQNLEHQRVSSTVTIEPGRFLVAHGASCVNLGRASVRIAPSAAKRDLVLPDTLNEDSCDAPDEQADASTTND
jgi:hypothetical protein